MSTTVIETRHLRLVLDSVEATRAQIDAMIPSQKAELSAEWLERVESAVSADPWIHGFSMVRRVDDAMVGQCGFKGPPTPEGVVEIAYAVELDNQGKGYATEAAGALTSFAFRDGEVRLVRAHTLPESNASTRVLTKCGFRKIGEVTDPEDGLVWRWDKHDQAK